MSTVEAIILAGGEVYGVGKTLPKAEIKINNQSILIRMVEVLRATGKVNNIVVVSPEEFSYDSDVVWAPAGETMMESTSFGLSSLKSERPALVIFADVVFASQAAIGNFIDSCLAYPQFDIWCAYVAYDNFQLTFPGVRKTCAYIRTGRRVNKYCMAGIGMIRPDKGQVVAETVDRLAAQRKNVLALAWTIGPANFFWYLLGRMGFERLETEMSRLLGVKIRAVESNFAELAFDIDNMADLEIAKVFSKKFEGA